MGDMVNAQSGQSDQDEDPSHARQGLYPDVFNIQALFLVKAIGVLDLGAIAPLRENGLGIRFVLRSCCYLLAYRGGRTLLASSQHVGNHQPILARQAGGIGVR